MKTEPKPRQILMVIIACHATTKRGSKCQFRSKYGPFCGHHRRLPKPQGVAT